MFQTAMSAQRLNSASAELRSPKVQQWHQNYVGRHLLEPSASNMMGSEISNEPEFKTFQEQHSPIHKAAQERSAAGNSRGASPKVLLDDLVHASQSRLKNDSKRSPSPSRSPQSRRTLQAGSPMSHQRPKTDVEKRFSALIKPPASAGLQDY